MSRVTPDFLKLYEEELQFLRESGSEFASDHPALAPSLGLKNAGDPSIDRLLEGVAFLSARVRLKLSTSERQIAHELLAALTPLLVQPLPSAAIVSAGPELGVDQISTPIRIPRGTIVHGYAGASSEQCQFRTCQDAVIHPWRLRGVQFLGAAALAAWRGTLPKGMQQARSALRLTLEIGAQAQSSEFPVEKFSLFVRGDGATPSRLLKALLIDAIGVASFRSDTLCATNCGGDAVTAGGFAEDESMYERGHTQYPGHRLLTEFFALPERFQFVHLRPVAAGELKVGGAVFDILLPLARDYPGIAEDVERATWDLDAIPIVNEYVRRLDRLPWSPGQADLAVIVDRLRPMAHEVLQILDVRLYSDGGKAARARSVLDPFGKEDSEAGVSYHVRRRIRAPWRMRSSPRADRKRGIEEESVPSTVYISIVSAHGPAELLDTEQVAVTALVCDGDLPQRIWRGNASRWTIDASGGLRVRMLIPPTPCLRGHLARGDEWALVSTLRQSLESMLMSSPGTLATRLRRLLGLFALDGSARSKRLIESLRDVTTRSLVRPAPGGGPLAYCRGTEVTIETGNDDVDSAGVFVLSMVLDRFLGGHCSINAFTQLAVRTPLLETSWKWPARRGSGELL